MTNPTEIALIPSKLGILRPTMGEELSNLERKVHWHVCAIPQTRGLDTLRQRQRLSAHCQHAQRHPDLLSCP